MVHKLASPDHKKVLNNIVKEQRRAKAAKNSRRQDQGSEEEDGNYGDDSDQEMQEDFKELRGRGARSVLVSKLVEGDNPLDFLDNSMIPKIYKGTKREPCALPEKDGKFVIDDLAKVRTLIMIIVPNIYTSRDRS